MKPSFKIRDMVFFKAAGEMHGYVTGVLETPGCFMYRVGWSDGTEGWHYDFELSAEKMFTT